MDELSLQSLAKRVEALEKAIAAYQQTRCPKDWRKTVGMFRESEFMREVDEECLRAREAERESVRFDDARVPGPRLENWLD